MNDMEIPKITVKQEMFSEKRKKKSIIVIAASIIILFIHPVFSAVIFFLYFAYIKSVIHKRFLKEFAKVNNFEFRENMDIDELKSFKARLFSYGRSIRAYNVLSKEYKGHPMKIFNFHCTVGSGKNKQTFTFTIVKINFEKTEFPHILLKSNKMRRYQSFDFFGQNKDSEIRLEEEFSDSFKLFCTQDYEIEVLQIFSRELLTDLEKFEGKFSIEFGGNDIFIYRDKILTKEKNIRELIKVVDTILEKSGPLINRLHDDFDSMREAYSNGGGEND